MQERPLPAAYQNVIGGCVPRPSDADPPPRLPVKLDRCSNGEYVPPQSTPALRHAHRTALEGALDAARRVGVDRRHFLASPRLRIHGITLPQAHGTGSMRDDMQALKEKWQIAAWKLYPVWGPQGIGYRMDDPETGMQIVQAGLDLGVPLFAIHKGLPLPGMDPSFTRADDIGPVAKAFPAATFLIYHSGFEAEVHEGPHDPKATRGIDALIRSCREHGIGRDGNVYAELGSLWRELMKDPDQAAHALGKLLAHFGPDRILWGTDAIWYGSPQDQIQAFRAFEISTEFQERHGYPALTPETKRKIFGLNGARVYGVDVAEIRRAQAWDPVARARDRYRHDPQPSHQTYGPRNRRELLRLIALNHGLPG